MADGKDVTVVGAWRDIDGHPALTGQEKDRVAEVFKQTEWEVLVMIPEWLAEDDDRDLVPLEASDRLYVGNVNDYSEKAWRFTQPHTDEGSQWDDGTFLPKSEVAVFERGASLEIEAPQQGLTEYGGQVDG